MLALTWASPSRAVPSCGATICTFAIGGGWEVEVGKPFYDAGLIDVISNAVNPGTSVEITKEATFVSNNTLILTFNQLVPTAVPTIIINNESVTNDTGVTWTGFEMVTVSGATFDAAASASFDVSPFTSLVFSTGDTKFSASGGGSILDEGVWTPGATGDLFIDPTIGAGTGESPLTVFALKETPVPVPEPSPGVLVAMGLVGIAMRARRRTALA